MAPFRCFHLDNGGFGDDALDFSTERWLQKENPSKLKGYYPFGGGRTICSGRKTAQSEVFSFIATPVTRFKFEPVEAKRLDKGKHRVSEVDLNKPALITLDPKGELLARLKHKM